MSFLNLSLDPLLVVETSPESLTTSPNSQFSVNCTARAEVDGELPNVTIEWSRLILSPLFGTRNLSEPENETVLETKEFTKDQAHTFFLDAPSNSSQNTSTERGYYHSVLTTSENDTFNAIIYRCTATVSSYSSFSDITIFVEGIETAR